MRASVLPLGHSTIIRKSFVISKSHCSPVQWVSNSPPYLFFTVAEILGDVVNTQFDVGRVILYRTPFLLVLSTIFHE